MYVSSARNQVSIQAATFEAYTDEPLITHAIGKGACVVDRAEIRVELTVLFDVWARVPDYPGIKRH
jgi:hypothetical protein